MHPLRGVSVAGGGAIGGGRAAVPTRAVVQAVAPGVVEVEQQTVTRLFLHRNLESVVLGVVLVQPGAQHPVILIDYVARVAAQGLPKVVLDARADGQASTGQTVDVVGAEQLVPLGSYVVQLDRQLGQKLVLQAEVVVVHVGIAKIPGNDAGQVGKVRVTGVPAVNVAGRLHSNALADVSGCSREG